MSNGSSGSASVMNFNYGPTNVWKLTINFRTQNVYICKSTGEELRQLSNYLK